MPKATLDYYDNNFSPLSAADYCVLIANYPDLGPMASTMEIPSSAINRVRVELMGKSKVFPGRRISSSNEVNITFTLNRRTQTYQQLLAIRDSFSESGTGNIVGQTFDIRAIHYDETGLEAMVITFHDCWLAEVGGYSLEGSAEAQILVCPCVFCYSTTSYSFTGMGTIADFVIATIINRITNEPIDIGNATDRYGAVPALDIKQGLPGKEPLDMIASKRSALASYVGLTLDDLSRMSDIISSVRGALGNFESKYSRIKMAANTKDYQSVINNLKSLSGIRSIF
jgi:hypothetical protein